MRTRSDWEFQACDERLLRLKALLRRKNFPPHVDSLYLIIALLLARLFRLSTVKSGRYVAIQKFSSYLFALLHPKKEEGRKAKRKIKLDERKVYAFTLLSLLSVLGSSSTGIASCASSFTFV
jgi:hypothetical protein